MRIRRPRSLESSTQRYKKQRLTTYDRKQERLATSPANDQELSSVDDQHQEPADAGNDQPDTGLEWDYRLAKWEKEPRLICYCREPEEDEDLVQCRNELCLIGWYHARCVENDSLLSEGNFICDFCSHRATSSDSELSVASDFSPLVDTNYRAETPETEKLFSNHGSFVNEREDQRQVAGHHSDTHSPDGSQDVNKCHDQPVTPEPIGPPSTPNAPNLYTTIASSPGGFTPINRRLLDVSTTALPYNLDGIIDSKPQPIVDYRAKAHNADLASFADFAPFISYDVFPSSPSGIREQDVVNFEAWRLSMPRSKLLACLKPGGIVALKDLPKGQRQDLRRRAKDWVDRVLRREKKSLVNDLSEWIEGKAGK
jgi:hypothetical protein